MVKIKRSACSVIVYDETQLRGIVFPASETTDINQFVEEVQQIASSGEIKAGTRLNPLLFNPEYKDNYRAMGEFFEGKEGPQFFDDDKQAQELYDFYFCHSMPVISSEGVNYIYMGKEYHSEISSITISEM